MSEVLALKQHSRPTFGLVESIDDSIFPHLNMEPSHYLFFVERDLADCHIACLLEIRSRRIYDR